MAHFSYQGYDFEFDFIQTVEMATKFGCAPNEIAQFCGIRDALVFQALSEIKNRSENIDSEQLIEVSLSGSDTSYSESPFDMSDEWSSSDSDFVDQSEDESFSSPYNEEIKKEDKQIVSGLDANQRLILHLISIGVSEESLSEIVGQTNEEISDFLNWYYTLYKPNYASKLPVNQLCSTPSEDSNGAIPFDAEGILDVKLPNGEKFIGSFRQGKREGYGEQELPCGAKYKGEFHNDKRHGEGIFTDIGRNVYKGTFFKDWLQGQGTLTYRSGVVYIGNFKYFMKQGKGKLTKPDGTEYSGDFVDDAYDGQGLLNEPGNGFYIGQFKANAYNGKGKLTYESGIYHEGNFVNGLLEEGEINYPHGVRILGNWRNGVQVGKCTFMVNGGKWESPDEHTTKELLSNSLINAKPIPQKLFEIA